MSRDREAREPVLISMGICLMCVQSAERSFEGILRTVLKDKSASHKIMLEVIEGGKPTLGTFIRELKKRVRLEPHFKDKLYHFLKCRNIFIHNLAEVPGGWDLETKNGRQIANTFVLELAAMAVALQALFLSVMTISAKDDFGKDISDGNELVAILEKHMGSTARKILSGRTQ